MNFTDTHTHLYAEEFKADRDAVIRRAIDSGISAMFLPNIDVHSIQPMLDVVWSFPANCFPMIGLHPCSVDNQVEANLFQIQKWLKKRKFYAIGEIGLDYYWSVEFRDQQLSALKKQLQWAVQLDMPVVLHSRNATDDLIKIVRDMNNPRLKGIFHCFSGTPEQAREIISLGFYLGIGGVLTFKNSGLDQAIEDISAEYLVLETDSPYLAPVPHRGKRNESAYLLQVAQKLSELKKIPLEKIAEITTANAKRIFRY